MSYIIAALLSAVGAKIQTVTGFGFPMVIDVAVLSVIMPTAMSLSVAAPVTLFMKAVLAIFIPIMPEDTA